MKFILRILIGFLMTSVITCPSCKSESNVKEQTKRPSTLMELAEYVRTLDYVSYDEACDILDQAGTFMLNAKFRTQDDVIDMMVAYNEYDEAVNKLRLNFGEADLTQKQIDHFKELKHRIRRGENVIDARIRAAGLTR